MTDKAEIERTHPADTTARTGGHADVPTDHDQLQADIERTRADLAQTVDKISARLDVRARLRHRVLDARDVAAQRLRVVRRRTGDVRTKASPRIGIGSGILAAALAVVVVTWWRSNHESRRRWGRRH
ncbi:MAG TPA: DUF3618 domain-containing protein [Nocardioides sp.]|nr:DUF3618 domain-containing protein [Nocardioides sp.]